MATISGKQFLQGGTVSPLQNQMTVPVAPAKKFNLSDTKAGKGFKETTDAVGKFGKTYVKNLYGAYSKAIPNFLAEAGRDDETTSDNPVINVAENAMGATASALSTVFAPFTEGLKTVTDAVSDNPKVQKLASTDAVGKVLDPIKKAGDYAKKIAKENPEAARNIMNAVTIALTVAGKKGLDKPLVSPKVTTKLPEGSFPAKPLESFKMEKVPGFKQGETITKPVIKTPGDQIYFSEHTLYSEMKGGGLPITAGKPLPATGVEGRINDYVATLNKQRPGLGDSFLKKIGLDGKYDSVTPEKLTQYTKTAASMADSPVSTTLADSSTLSPVLNATTKATSSLGGAAEYAASRVPKLLSIGTGESDDIIRIALKNPEIADKGIVGGDQALRAAVETGSQKSVQLRDSFIKGHSEAFRQLAGQNSGKLVSKQKVLYGFVEALESQGAKVSKGKLDFSISKIKANPGEVAKVNAAYEAIRNWNDFSLSGLNDLKQLVGKLTRFPTESGGTSKSPFLGRIYNQIDDTIKNSLPPESRAAYTEMNKRFAENIELYEDMVDAFNSGDPFVRLANSLGKNKDSLRQVMDFYESKSGEKVLPIVAGRELAMEKTSAFSLVNPRSYIDFFISPKLQAKAVTKFGKMFPGSYAAD